jgi:isoamylase
MSDSVFPSSSVPDDASSNALRSVPPALGTHWTGNPGFSSLTVAVPVGHNVSTVEFCLLEHHGESSAERRYELPNRLGNVAWGEIADVAIGATYGFRASGGNADANKFLVDPYARAITGTVDWLRQPGAHRLGSGIDTSVMTPQSVITDPRFEWGSDQRPNTPWAETVIYEAHVKSATKLHSAVPELLRGTYAGIANQAFVDHLLSLGITAIELLPVHQHVDEERLAGLGLTNHWGYNTLGFFAPDNRFSASGSRGQQVTEFKGMVKLLHEAGIEVILDVVYNHTGEGGRGGAALSLRGLDPDGWYREPDVTGCGNTVDLRQPPALKLVLDSLRYWITECHVDGFRFDLAPALCRTDFGFSSTSGFLAAVNADPVLSQVKLISEPWDIGVGGYQLGGFPAPWAEWNDRYRDSVRDLWCGNVSSLGEAAARITGSSDLFAGSRRAPWASINFVAAHDGMCTADLSTYNGKHNEANKENNRDGTDNNRSNNCGVEGPTTDAVVLQHRAQMQRNLLATLLLSQGVPMLLCGDEIGNTQAGNNNAYCQDNEISWVNWAEGDSDLHRFVSSAITLRKTYPALRQADWLRSQDAKWFALNGAAMDEQQWSTSRGFTLQIDAPDPAESSVLIIVNNDYQNQMATLPPGEWIIELDTSTPRMQQETDRATASINNDPAGAKNTVLVGSRSLLLLAPAAAVDATAT